MYFLALYLILQVCRNSFSHFSSSYSWTNQKASSSENFFSTRHFIKLCPSVLILAGIELIFFTVTGKGLCFGFVLDNNNTGMLSYC